MSTLTSEMLDLRTVVRDFMKREVIPAESQAPHDAYKLPHEVLLRLQDRARASGLWCLGSPEEYGGAGLGLLARSVVAEEAAQCRMGAYVPACGAFGWDPPGVIFSGTDEQIRKYAVPAIEAGDRKTFVAISVFENYRVPVANRLGEEGQGFAVAQDWLVNARVPYAAGVIGVAVAALRLAAEYVADRETFGKPLASRQSVQWMLADSEIEIRAARLLIHDAAQLVDNGRPFKTEASIAKLYATEAAGRVIDRCIQMLGAMGVAQELPLERWYRELRIKRIGEGPSEVHRMVVAREILRHPSGRG